MNTHDRVRYVMALAVALAICGYGLLALASAGLPVWAVVALALLCLMATRQE